MLLLPAAPVFDVALVERRQASPGILADRLDQGEMRSPGRATTQLDLVLVFTPVGDVGYEIDPESAAGRQHAGDGRQSGHQIAIDKQRLQNSVRREHHRERAWSKGQLANVAAHRVDVTDGARAGAIGHVNAVRGDIRELPFAPRAFSMVLAPYGILQSLLVDRDLVATLASVARVLAPGGRFGIDLVPDVPNWREYENKIQLRGRATGGAHLTLIESVRQDPGRRLTTFNQRYVENRGGRKQEHQFELTFRTLSVRQVTRRLDKAGFAVEAVLGDYRGRPLDDRSDVWIMLARRGRA